MMIKEIIDYIFPKRCPICDKIVGDKLICEKCDDLLPRITGPVCLKCGKGIDNYEDELCFDCDKNPKIFTKGFPVFHYVEPMLLCMYGFKYNNKREYKHLLIKKLIEKHSNILHQMAFDVIIPIPVHKKRLKQRGYNQAALLAYELSKELGVLVDESVLSRNAKTAPQKNLNNEERIKNLIKAFNCNETDVKYNKVLLVDDIYTTGATMEACTKLLITNGVKEVCFTTICIGKGQ